MKPKLLELSEELDRFNYDLMTLSETWLKSSVPNRLLTLSGYNICRADRPDGKGYGGVALLSRDFITTEKLRIPAPPHPDSRLETLWVRVTLSRGRRLVIGSVYRPPRHTAAALSADFADLECQYQRVLMDYPNSVTVLSGDFNCDLLKGDSDPACRSLKRFVSDFAMSQFINSPTYATGSLLDVLIVSGLFVSRCGTRFCHFSPHYFVRAQLSLPVKRRKRLTVSSRSLKRIDMPLFLHELISADWSPVFRSVRVTEQWDSFTRIFMPILDRQAPVRDITIRNPTAPPVSEATRDLMARRRRALRDLGRDSHEYRDLNRTVRSAIRRDTRDDIDRRIRESGPDSVWRNLRSVVGNKKSGQRVLPSMPVEQLNRFFVDVGPRVAAEVAGRGPRPQLECRLPRVSSRTFAVTPVSQEVMRRTLFSMRNTSSGGRD